MIEYVNLHETKYRKFHWEKYGACGANMRHQLDDCVQELIVGHFPVETGKRKRGYQSG